MIDFGNNNKAASQKEVAVYLNGSAQHSKSIYLVPRRCNVWHYLEINF